MKDVHGFVTLGKLLWLVVIAQGLALEVYAQWFDKDFCTFTSLVKEFVKPTFRAALIGVLFYHFVIQPIFEALNKQGIKIF